MSFDGSGKRSVIFSNALGSQFVAGHKVASDFEALSIPCGKCIGCRLERSRQWALRCLHESRMHEDNCFVTLTFDDAHLPVDMSIRKRDMQLFMKRLRNRFGSGIRFFGCGEYGSISLRPHYHLILFGFDFKDKVLYKQTRLGHYLYTSAELSKLWTDPNGVSLGFAILGDVSFDSAGYVARYCMKKVSGDHAAAHYQYVSPSGEIFQREPEFCLMSRRPGLGKAWYDKYKSDVFPSDWLVVNGKKCKPPRYYDGKASEEDLAAFEAIQEKRRSHNQKKSFDNSFDRLGVRETCKELQASRLVRTI